MKNPFTTLKHLAQLFVAAGCVSCANASDNNVAHVNAAQAQMLIADKKVSVLRIVVLSVVS